MTATFPPTEGYGVERKWTDHRADIQPGWHPIDLGGPVSRALAEDHALMRRIGGRCQTRVVRVSAVVEVAGEPERDVVLPGQLSLFGGGS